jgi:hypothetical protein
VKALKKIIIYPTLSLLFLLLSINISSYAQNSETGENGSADGSNILLPIIIALISAGVSIFSLIRNENTAKLSREHEAQLAESVKALEKWKTGITDARERELATAQQQHEEKLTKWKAEREKELADAKKADDLMMEQWRHEREQKRDEEKARREYEYEARKRLYLECEPILFQLHQLCEAADRRISHMPRRMKEDHFFSKDKYLEKKESLKKSEEKSPVRQEEEGVLKDKLGWLSFPNYYMLSTIYHLLAPMATFKILQDRLTTVDLELDPLIKKIYLISKHLYATFSSDTDLAEIAEIPYKTYDQGIFVGYLDNATEELIKHYDEPNKVPRIKSFGEFNKQYVKGDNFLGSSEKKVDPPFDRIYDLLHFFHPNTKEVLWRILIEQLYLYNAINEVYEIKETDNYQDRIEKENKVKPIRRIPKGQLDNYDYTDKSFIDVEKHLLSQPELNDLIDDDIKKSHASESRIQSKDIFFK